MSNQHSDSPRQELLADCRRVVIKVGSRLLMDAADQPLQTRIDQLITEIAELRRRNWEVILVSSGAIAVAIRQLQPAKKPSDMPRLQALAAIGQSHLMACYERACQRHGFHCGQMLVSRDDLEKRLSHLNVCNCLNALLARDVLPVINENDSVCVDEIRFGDNDTLAAYVAAMTRADLTILLTTEDGLRQRTPDGSLADRIAVVTAIDDHVRALAGDTDGNQLSTGGMVTKIRAAEICTTAGEPLWIANGSDFAILRRIRSGDDVGTVFLPPAGRLRGAKRYLAFFSEPTGTVVIDPGAVAALANDGRSLLPRGIAAVDGNFAAGDTIAILDSRRNEIGLGISNYCAADLRQIQNLRTPQIAEALGSCPYKEAVHRDNMVVWPAGQAPNVRS